MTDLQTDEEIFRQLADGLTLSSDEGKEPEKQAKKERSKTPAWALAERLYVEGELVGDTQSERTYKTFHEISVATGLSTASIGQRVRRYKWVEKRALFQSANGIVSPRNGGKVLVSPSAGHTIQTAKRPNPGPRSRPRDPLGIVNTYIDHFAKSVELDEVRHDTIADFDRAVRVRAFLMGQAEQIKEQRVSVSLEVMQARHRELRVQAQTLVDDGVAGVLGKGRPAAQDAEIIEEPSPELAGVLEVPVPTTWAHQADSGAPAEVPAEALEPMSASVP